MSDAILLCLSELRKIPNINLGGCCLVAAELARRIPGARVFPVLKFDTDDIRDFLGDGCTSLQDIMNYTGRGWFHSFQRHIIVRLPDGREIDSNGIYPNNGLSVATGEGFSAEEASEWFWDEGVSWNRSFNRSYADRIVSICSTL